MNQYKMVQNPQMVLNSLSQQRPEVQAIMALQQKGTSLKQIAEVLHDMELNENYAIVSFQKIEELLSMPNLKQEWQLRRQKMLSEKIDYAQFLTWFIEYYPDSRKTMRDNPDCQWQFK